MKIGVPREVKNNEYRVSITPSGVHEMTSRGHSVFVQSSAGEGSSISDDDFSAAGAHVVPNAAEAWGEADLVLKVKEPIASEYQYLRKDLTLFTYLHLAADEALTKELVAQEVTAISYETVELANRSLPLLAPMSEVAGRLATQMGAHTLLAAQGGRGTLLGGVPGVRPGNVVIIGAGTAGRHAATIAVGMGADVTILDRDVQRLRDVDVEFAGRVRTLASNALEIEKCVVDADLVIGAVLVSGAKAPKLVSNAMVATMKPGSVLVDISIDQGGCFEASVPTTHADPTYSVHNSLFYCVANIPGAVPHTSTYALTNVTLPYLAQIADRGWKDALKADPALALGLNAVGGQITCDPVAKAHHLESIDLAAVLS